MLEFGSVGRGKGSQGPHLIDYIVFRLRRRDHYIPAAESQQIGESRVGADPHTVLYRQGYDPIHHYGIASVVAAGNVGGGDMPNHIRIHANGVDAVALTQIAVQIYLIHLNRASSTD